MTIKTQFVNRIVHNAEKKSAEVFIYDEIGPSDWGYIGAKDFVSALKAIGDVESIDVRINSPGGSVWEANAIYNALKNHKAKINVYIDGIAFSAASYIAMAGDQITIAENAMMMIHNASSFVWGNAEALTKEATLLGQIDSTIVGIYAARTKLPVKDIADMMAAETWFTSSEAMAKGFATAVSPNKSVSAHVDLSKFKNTPDWAKQALTNLSKEREMSLQTEAEKKAAADAKAAADKVAADAKALADKQAAEAKAAADKAAADAAAKLSSGGTVTMTAAELEAKMNAVANAAVTAARTRDSEIDALCAQAKVPHMAAEFKANPAVTVAAVKDTLWGVLCAKNVPVGGITGNPADNGAGGSGEAKYKAEYAMHKDLVYTPNGITEEQYIKSRKLEDGIS